MNFSKHTKSLSLVVAGCLLAMVSCHSYEPLPTVDRVDIERYQGKWCEIARLPQRFEENCVCVTAEYAIRDDGNIKVNNTCLDTVAHKMKVSEGKAFPQKGSENPRLKVQFFFPFKGDYYVVALDESYEYAMIGTPSRENLWILAREPSTSTSVKHMLVEKAKQLGFDTADLIYTKQSCEKGDLKT